MTAPVVGSGSWPAWMAAVCGPMGESVAMAASGSCRRRIELLGAPTGAGVYQPAPRATSSDHGSVVVVALALALVAVVLAGGLATVIVVLALVVPVAVAMPVAGAIFIAHQVVDAAPVLAQVHGALHRDPVVLVD